MTGLGFDELRRANVARCEDVFHPLMSWNLAEWGCAAAGEVGEACNVAKKIHRGDFDSSELWLAKAYEDLGAELADAVIYLDLWAARAGIDLGEAVIAKFNRVSEKRGSEHTLRVRERQEDRVDSCQACSGPIYTGKGEAALWGPAGPYHQTCEPQAKQPWGGPEPLNDRGYYEDRGQ